MSKLGQRNEIDNEISRVVRSALMTVENCMHDTILTDIYKLVITRVEMAVKSITGCTGHGTHSEVQNPDRKDFLGNIRNSCLCRPQVDWI